MFCNKVKTLSCLLLILVLIVSLQATAVAETGYALIKESISKSNETGYSEDFNEYSFLWGDLVTLSFYPWKNQVSLIGRNEIDHLEITIWECETEVELLGLLGAYCSLWDSFNDVLDEGYKFTIEVHPPEEDSENEPVVIDTSEKAQMMFEVTVQTMFSSLQ